jgi:hypothetical protein
MQNAAQAAFFYFGLVSEEKCQTSVSKIFFTEGGTG